MNADIVSTCCFTGYRPEKLPWGYDESDRRCERLKAAIYDSVITAYECCVTHFICGMALGADTYFGEAVIKLKEKYNNVILEAAIPFEGQSAYWSSRDRERYNIILSHCDKKTVLSDRYTKFCMMKRNIYMVDNSSLLICVYDGKPGGTKNTVDYAQRKKLSIVQLSPENGTKE